MTTTKRATRRCATVMVLGVAGAIGCTEDMPEWFGTEGAEVRTILWSDGDSGAIDGAEFRLADVDAPETGPVGSRYGARCEGERSLGIGAQSFMERETRGARIEVARGYEEDGFGREVVELLVDGRDIARVGMDAGYLAPWPFDRGSGQALASKPDWCAR